MADTWWLQSEQDLHHKDLPFQLLVTKDLMEGLAGLRWCCWSSW